MCTVCLPEAAHRRFRNTAFTALSSRTAHLQDGFLVRGSGNAALNEATDAAILHRNVACRTDKIGLFQTHHPLFRRVVGKAEICPIEIGAITRTGTIWRTAIAFWICWRTK